MLLTLLLLAAPNTDSLGAEEYSVREEAEERLKSLGCLAWPQLLKAERSESPEIRDRAYRLLAPYRYWSGEATAAAILGGRPCHIPTVFNDHVLRIRMYRQMIAMGWPASGLPYHLHPDNDQWEWWSASPPQEKFERYLAACQKEIAIDLKQKALWEMQKP